MFDRVLTTFHDTLMPPGPGASGLQQTIERYTEAVVAGAPAVRNRGPWRFHHTLGACARSPELRRKYAGLQAQAIARITQAARVGQEASTVRDDLPAERVAELLVIVALGVAAMREIEAPFDLVGGADALARVFAPPQPPRKKPNSRAAREQLAKPRARKADGTWGRFPRA